MKRNLRILACLLTLCVLLGSLSSCMTISRFGEFARKWEKGEFPVYDASWREYTLTREDWTAFEKAVEDCRSLIEKDSSSVTIDRSMMEMQDLYYHIMTQAQVAYILYSMDMGDRTARSNYLEASEMQTDAYDVYMSLCQELYNSDYSYRDRFFSSWSEEELAMMHSYSDKVVDLNNANDQIVVKYRDLRNSSSDSFSKQTGKLFLQLVENNNAIAKEYGYDFYPAYAYETVYFRDYELSDVETLRGYVKEYLIPLCSQAYDRFRENYGKLTNREQDQISELLYDDCNGPDAKWLRFYFKSLPAYMQRLMLDTLDSEHAVYVDDEDALEGAFTGYLYEYGYPVCYFGPGYQASFTVAHEAGHYFASYAQKGMSQNIDLAEVYSQSNEFLFLAFLADSDLDEDVYSVLADYQLYQSLSVIIVATIIDEFEQTVYTNSERFASLADNKKTTELDKCMKEICQEYGGMKFVNEYLTSDINQYWKYVVIENPMYYISYAMSGIASLDLYCKATKDYEDALEIYMDLAAGALIDGAFLENLENVGLSTPFDEDVYVLISQLVQ